MHILTTSRTFPQSLQAWAYRSYTLGVFVALLFVCGGTDTRALAAGPTVSVTTATNGATVIATATATDDIGVAGVRFKVDGANIGAEDTASPYNVAWDITNATEGNHTITAVARDTDGNLTTSSGATVIVDNIASSITQYGITWTFDREYQYGQFVNGDYWVVGPVVIRSITPDATPGRNGWEINPQSHTNQPYDNRISNYNAASQPSLPTTVPGGSSVVKAVSALNPPTAHAFLQTAAVLTVLSSVPTDRGATLFRPPYYGTSKPSYSVNSMDLGVLPSLTPVAKAPSLDTIAGRFQRVQLDHKEDWMGRLMHPIDNMPDYGATIATGIAEGVLRLSLNDSVADKRQAGIMMTQMGIDWYQLRASGQNWRANGGHLHGRKLAILFAGIVLRNQAMKDAVTNAPTTAYQENDQIIQSAQANGGKGMALWGQTGSVTQYWTELSKPGTGAKTLRDPYGYIDGGSVPGGDYQFCCTSQPFKGSAIAAKILPNGVTLWNDPKFFAYVERWVKVGTWTQPDPCAPFDGDSTHYGVTYGPDPKNPGKCILDTNPSDGIGRFPARHGANVNGGYYGSAFVNNMYGAYYGATIPIPSAPSAPAAPVTPTPTTPATTPSSPAATTTTSPAPPSSRQPATADNTPSPATTADTPSSGRSSSGSSGGSGSSAQNQNQPSASTPPLAKGTKERIAPWVNLLSPKVGQRYTNRVNIRAISSDKSGIRSMTISVNGIKKKRSNTSSISYTYSRKHFASARISILIQTYDRVGNVKNVLVSIINGKVTSVRYY